MSTDAADESDALAETEVFGFRIKSDNLRTLRPLVDWAAEQTGGIDRLPRVYLIMDANTIRGELRFRIRRNDPEGRTRLDEILASGIATVFAPPFLLEEVEKHLAKWSRQLKIPLDRLTAKWKLYQEGLVFCRDVPVGTEPARRLAARDPKDLPYVYLQANLSAEAILTADKDIIETGSPTADGAVILDLGEYARNQSVVVTIAAGSATGVLLFVKAIMALGRLLVRSVVGLILSLAAGALLWFVHRKEKAKAGSSSFTRIWEMFKDCLKTLLRTLDRSHKRAKLRWKRLMTAFSKVKRRTLRQFVFVVCAIARKALTIIEIVARVLAEGHRTRAKRFRSQVRRCLKTDPRFLETPKAGRSSHGRPQRKSRAMRRGLGRASSPNRCPPAAQTDPTRPNSSQPDLTKVAVSARESVQAPEVPGLSDVFDSRRLHCFSVTILTSSTADPALLSACCQADRLRADERRPSERRDSDGHQ